MGIRVCCSCVDDLDVRCNSFARRVIYWRRGATTSTTPPTVSSMHRVLNDSQNNKLYTQETWYNEEKCTHPLGQWGRLRWQRGRHLAVNSLVCSSASVSASISSSISTSNAASISISMSASMLSSVSSPPGVEAPVDRQQVQQRPILLGCCIS